MYRLMIKTHNITGLKYLCVTSNKEFELYKGSGVYWKRHLKKYGKDIRTEILTETESPSILHAEGLKYSALYDVVESDEWANLVPESGYHLDKIRSGWFGWYNGLTNKEKKQRNKNISEKVTLRLAKLNKNEFSAEMSRRRLSLSKEKKEARKEKIKRVYETGKHQTLFERYSKERLGKNNPNAKSICLENITYGSIQEASRKTGIPAYKLYRISKRQENKRKET